MNSPATSLADPPTGSPLAEGVAWVQGVAFGATATAIAVLGIAAVGLLMLSGRSELRRGTTVAVGCFILFGGSAIASTLIGLSSSDRRVISDREPIDLRIYSSQPNTYDPYAGASVPAVR